MTLMSVRAFLGAVALGAGFAPAQSYLVKDINLTPGGPFNSTAAVGAFAPLPDGRVLYSTRIGLHASDGTTAGSTILSATPMTLTSPVSVPGRVVFLTGWPNFHLWSTDGTANGTGPVLDSQGGTITVNNTHGLVGTENRAFFYTGLGSQLRLWSTDGTGAGTTHSDAPAGIPGTTHPFQFGAVGDRSYFTSFDNTTPDYQLWSSDAASVGGTTIRTTIPSTTLAGVGPTVSRADRLWFAAGRNNIEHRAWYWLVPPLNTPQSVPSSSIPSWWGPWTVLGTLANGTIIYQVGGNLEARRELWATTPSQAVRLVDLLPIGESAVRQTVVVDGLLYFTTETNSRLWRTNGTAAGTYPIAVPAPGNAARIENLTAFDGACWFTMNDAAGWAWWRATGTQGDVTRVAPFPAGATISANVARHAATDTLFFSLTASIIGSEVWTMDPSGAMNLLHDLSSATDSSSPTLVTSAAGKVYFNIGSTITNATGLWMTNGNVAGTVRLDPAGSATFFRANLVYPGRTHVLFSDGNGLWSHDGTSAEAVRLGPPVTSRLSQFLEWHAPLATARNGMTFYCASLNGSSHVWRTDGTVAGTVQVTTQADGFNFGSIGEFASIGAESVIFFPSTSVHGQEPWISDGTAAGTRLVRNTVPGFGSNVADIPVSLGDVVMWTSGSQMWRTDGTSAGTHTITGLSAGQFDKVVVNGKMFFSFPVSDRFLRITDGSQAGTLSVPAVTNATSFGEAFGRAIIGGPQGVFASDGTAAGTTLITNVAPTPLTRPSKTFFNGPDGAAYYFAAGGLWRTDGTSQGTTLHRTLAPVNSPQPPIPSVNNSQPGLWAGFAGAKLVFTAHSPAFSIEPWAIDVGPILDCDANGTPDAIDIALGNAPDANGDGVPDTCPCPADWNASGSPVSAQDIFDFLEDWFADDADFNHSGATTAQDIFDFLNAWFAGCP